MLEEDGSKQDIYAFFLGQIKKDMHKYVVTKIKKLLTCIIIILNKNIDRSLKQL